MDYSGIIAENAKRVLKYNAHYDPIKGIGSFIPREHLSFEYAGANYEAYLPVPMMDVPIIKMLKQEKSIAKLVSKFTDPTAENCDIFYNGLQIERIKYDFEFWAATAFTIFNKDEGKSVPFVLNYPQRAILFPAIYEQLIKEMPIRVNVCKARQWGGSTLIDSFIFYIQNVLKANSKWNSVIIGEKERQAKNIRAMYKFAVRYYPERYGTIEFQPFEGTKDIQIKSNESVISVGSMQVPDGVRSDDIKCVHASEIGLWKKTAGKSPEDLIQSIHGTLANVPLSFSAYESTAKGVGNFFHNAWLNSIAGTSSYRPVFVPWYVIAQYSKPFYINYSGSSDIIPPEKLPLKWVTLFVDSWDEYEWFLWNSGATLDGIAWYKQKLFGEMEGDVWRMRSEFPTTAEEAFQSTGRPVFHPEYLRGLDIYTQVPFDKGYLESDGNSGDKIFDHIKFRKHVNGHMKVWSHPIPYKDDPVKDRYCVSLDIGGAHRDADWSIVTVIDRIWMIDGDDELEVVASARFHMDADLTVWTAVRIAKYYNAALFVPESNSIKGDADTEGDHILTVLDRIVDIYPNVYMRTDPEKIRQGEPARYGFHTTRKDKTKIIDNMIMLLREKKFIERDPEAIAEFKSYEHKVDGTWGNSGKMHDDYVMSRMIGATAAYEYMNPPKRINIEKQGVKRSQHRIKGEASI